MRVPMLLHRAILATLLALPLGLSAQYTPRSWPPAFVFTEVVPGIYAATEPDNPTGIVHGNTTFIVNASDVFVVDANHTPAAARATIAQLRRVTGKPVRTILYTHWHNDHYLGASAFAEAYPGSLRILATDSTRDDIVRLAAEVAKRTPDAYLKQSAVYDSIVASGHDLDGRELTAATPWRRAVSEDVARAYRNYYGPVSRTAPYLVPTETFATRMTLYMGDREIDLLAMRANTRSDGVAFLPKERVVITGDLVVYPMPYVSNSYPTPWLEALRAIRTLDPLYIVPGHGPVMRDTKYLDQLIGVVASVIDQARAGVAAGASLEQTQKQMSVAPWREGFTRGDPMLVDSWDSFIEELTALAYKEAKR